MDAKGLTQKDLIVYEGKIAPGFGADGGGLQWQMPLPIIYLEKLGLLTKID